MDGLIYALGVIVFFVGLMASIALHEVGHMWPAKKFGVKVTQYFVGFGRTVWSVRRGETEYGFKSIPLGGYVKLVGMLPPAKGDRQDEEHPERVRSTNTGMFTQLISDARAAEYEHVQPGDEDRLFYRKPWWQKLIVMSGGPMVNLLIAVFLFGVVFVGIGAPQATTTVSEVSQCVIPADQERQTCTDDDPVAPAYDAGIEPGDQIVSFNGQSVESWDDLTDMIRDNEAGAATIGVVRDGESLTLHTNTVVSLREDREQLDEFEHVGFLGVSPTQESERESPLFVATTMWEYTKLTGEAIIDMPERMVGVAQAAFGDEREDDSPMSVVGASRVAGELSTVDETTWGERAAQLLALLAAVNLFVALFNFIPLLPLDGGHIAGALWEAVRRGIARLRRRPDPGYVDVAKMLPVAYAVASVLIVMGALLVYADIVNPVTLE
ncbi:MAG TPA: site-2 protease family protein [Nocardioidaceae bacterium]|nr:site-2 protease family protein [Nocardioidaceae bacterium]